MDDGSTMDLGARLSQLRKTKGWSQEDLSAKSGVSVTVIGKLEQGGTARLETLHKIARVLEVRTVWFQVPGSPLPSPDLGDNTVLADIRSALIPPASLTERSPYGSADDEDLSLTRLRDAIFSAAASYHGDKYDELAAVIPGLVRSAHHHVSGHDHSERTEAIRLRGHILGLAGRWLIQVRLHDLAMIALGQSIRDARTIEDIPLAAISMSGQAWAMARQGRFQEVQQVCLEMAEQIEPRFSTATAAELGGWGWLMHRASAAAARNNDPQRATEYWQLTQAAAARMGTEQDVLGLRTHSTSRVSPGFTFGPVTAGLLKAENAGVAGNPDKVLTAHRNVPCGVGEVTPSTWNRAQLEKAKALVLLGKADEATRVMQRLRHTQPEWMKYQQMAKDVALSILESRTRMPSAEQRELANWLEVQL